MSTAQLIKLPAGVELWALSAGTLRNLREQCDRREAVLVATCKMHLARLSSARRRGLRVRFAWSVNAPCFFCARACVEIRKRGTRWSMLAVAPPPT